MSIIKHSDIIGPDDSIKALIESLEKIQGIVAELSKGLLKEIINPNDQKAVEKYAQSVKDLEALNKKALDIEKAIAAQRKEEKQLAAQYAKEAAAAIKRENKERADASKKSQKALSDEESKRKVIAAQRKADQKAEEKAIADTTAELKKQKAERDRAYKNSPKGKIDTAKARSANLDSNEAKELARINEEIRQKNKLNAEEARLNSALTSTYDKLAIRLNQLRKKYKDLVVVEKETSKEGRLLKTEIDKLDRSLKKADASVGQFQRNVGNYPKALNAARKAMINLASAAGVTFGAFGAVRLIQNAISIIADFETQLVAVGKTTNIQGESLKDLGNRFKDLVSGPLRGINLDSLLELAETAGQLGISGVDNITKFTETLARLEKGTDIVGQEGAQAIARILNVTNESVDTVDRFASSVVALGNNFAATESEIVANTIEIARGIAIYRVASHEAAALGTVTRALGIQSEVAGSALQRTFDIINTAVKDGGQKFLELQRITGSSAEKLREDYGKSSVDVFRQFIEGLSRIDEAGGNVSKTLKDMGINGIRYGKVLKPLVGRVDELNRALQLSEISNRQNTANLIESERALNTLNSEITGLQTAWKVYVLGLDDATKAGLKVRGTVRFISDNLEALIETIAVGVASFAAWRTVVFLSANAGKIWAGVTGAMSAVANVFRGNIQAATLSLRTFKTALATTGFGLVVIAISELIFNFQNLKDVISGTSPTLRKLQQEINTTADAKIGLIQRLLETTQGTDEYRLALLELQQAYPDLLSSIDLEKEGMEGLLGVINDVNEARISSIAIAKTQSKVSRIDDDIKEITTDLNNAIATYVNSLAQSGSAASKSIAVELSNPDNIKEVLKVISAYDKGDPLLPDYSRLVSDVAKQTFVDLRPLGDQGLEILKAIEREAVNLSYLENIRAKALAELSVVKTALEAATPSSDNGFGPSISKTIKDLQDEITQLNTTLFETVEADKGIADQAQIDEILAEIDEKQKYIDKLLGKTKKGAKGKDPAEEARKKRQELRKDLIDEQNLIVNKNKVILDNENNTYEQRIVAAEAISEAESRISQITEQDKIDQKTLSAARIKIIAEESAFDQEQIEADHLDRIAELDKEALDNRNEYKKYLNKEYQSELDNDLANLERSIKEQEDILKNATGKKKKESANELLKLYEEKADLEILLAETQARFDDIGASDEEKAITKIELTGEASKIRAELAAAKRAIEDAFDTDPLEQFRRVAENVFDRLLDRAVALQQRQSELAQRRIDESNTAISVQEQRAAQGQQNTLAFEKKRLAEREKLLQDHQKKLERIEKARAFFSLLSSNANSKGATSGDALAKTILEFSLAEAFVAGFKDGGYTGEGRTTDVAGQVHKREFVIDAPTVQRLGLKGASMSDFNRRFVPDSGGGVVDMEHFNKERGRLIKDVPVLNDVGIRKDLQKLIGIMESKEQTDWNFEEFANGILRATETKKRNGKTIVNKYALRP